ncbi:MAG: ABC transporter substrate-binding protein [Chloroflexota bacterium]|nr:ABC transporter substrate-binding protein [Chloroflexota bacterium]
MATDEILPPACAFAVSVLADYALDPETVPEEAVEAAQQHMLTCARCKNAPQPTSTAAAPRRKKKVRRMVELEPFGQVPPEEPSAVGVIMAPEQTIVVPQANSAASAPPSPPSSAELSTALIEAPTLELPPDMLTCQQCRQVLPEYAEAMDSGENVAMLYPEVQEHLLACETGCLVLLELLRQEARANRKYRRRLVRNPFSVMWWEVTGFFRGGHVPMAPRALAFGTLIFLLLFGALGAYLGIRWDDARYYHPLHQHVLPTPDGVGLSDGLKIYDACNASDYQDKRQAAQALAQGNASKALRLFSAAMTTGDTSGCNGAEAAIYREDAQVRQSGRPFGIVVVSFDSGPGSADPLGGTDRHILYAAYTQELVGAFIGQQQYDIAQMHTPGAPLLYLVLANTAGGEQGALQIANNVASLSAHTTPQQLGLLAPGRPPLLAVLGLAPSRLTQVVLPVLCRAGVPLIAPTATGLFIIDLLTQTSLYRHCTPGFAFMRFSSDDAQQSQLGADYAYNQLGARNVAIFYDPSNPSSTGSVQGFIARFTSHQHVSIVAQETAVASGLLDATGRPQASRDDLLAGLRDALQANPRPDLIFAPLLTNDVITLAQAIARLPQDQQPILLIGGEFVQPAGLEGLVPWARQNKLTLPRIFATLSTAARPPSGADWQKQFYATFCTSFATPGSFCSGAAALDQGALLFGDGIEMIAQGVGPITQSSQFPTSTQLVQHIAYENFAGVSGPIALHLWDDVLVTSEVTNPVILTLQGDGSIQIVS